MVDLTFSSARAKEVTNKQVTKNRKHAFRNFLKTVTPGKAGVQDRNAGLFSFPSHKGIFLEIGKYLDSGFRRNDDLIITPNSSDGPFCSPRITAHSRSCGAVPSFSNLRITGSADSN
jgi:hypothetical protein